MNCFGLSNDNKSAYIAQSLESSSTTLSPINKESKYYKMKMKVFSGTSNPEFSRLVTKHLDLNLSDVKIGRFADGEINVIITMNSKI